MDFDHVLRPGPLDGPNWRCRFNQDRYAAHVGPVWNAAGRTASGRLFHVLPELGPNVCFYDPPPFDVRSRSSNTPAAAFADFPIAVLP